MRRGSSYFHGLHRHAPNTNEASYLLQLPAKPPTELPPRRSRERLILAKEKYETRKKRSHVGYQCEILIDTYKWGGEEKNGTLDEQDRECYYAHSRAKNSVAFGYITVHGNSTENHDNQGEQGRRPYRKTVSTTCLNNKNLKPRTVHHHTNKPESVNIVCVRPFLKAAGGKAVCYISAIGSVSLYIHATGMYPQL